MVMNWLAGIQEWGPGVFGSIADFLLEVSLISAAGSFVYSEAAKRRDLRVGTLASDQRKIFAGVMAGLDDYLHAALKLDAAMVAFRGGPAPENVAILDQTIRELGGSVPPEDVRLAQDGSKPHFETIARMAIGLCGERIQSVARQLDRDTDEARLLVRQDAVIVSIAAARGALSSARKIVRTDPTKRENAVRDARAAVDAAKQSLASTFRDEFALYLEPKRIFRWSKKS